MFPAISRRFLSIQVPSPADVLVRFGAKLLDWQEKARQAKHLQSLDDRMLDDVGLTRSQVEKISRRFDWI